MLYYHFQNDYFKITILKCRIKYTINIPNLIILFSVLVFFYNLVDVKCLKSKLPNIKTEMSILINVLSVKNILVIQL